MHAARDNPVIHIRPSAGWRLISLKELSEYRDLFYFMVSRDIRIRYKQTILGGLWAVIQPFLGMVVFTIFFGRMARIPSDNTPYPIFSYTAMIAWTYFANTIALAGNSLLASSNLITKVYFPRIIIPLSPALAHLLDFFIAFLVLIAMMIYFGISPHATILAVPALVFIMFLNAAGMGMALAALNAQYRDVKYAIPFLVQVWMFASPIVYPASMIPEKYRLAYALNPMAGIIEGFRSALLGTSAFPATMVGMSFMAGSGLFVLGLMYFKRMERHFADIV